MKRQFQWAALGFTLVVLLTLSLDLRYQSGDEAGDMSDAAEGTSKIRSIRETSPVRLRSKTGSVPAPGELSRNLASVRESQSNQITSNTRIITTSSLNAVVETGPDLIPVVVRVIDASTSLPIEGVGVTVDGLHSGTDGRMSSHGGWNHERDGRAPSGVTDKDGTVTLASPFFWSEKIDVLGISFHTRHPDYAAHRETRYPIIGEMRDVVLSRGNTLSIRAYQKVDGEVEWLHALVPELHGRISRRIDWDYARHPEGGRVASSNSIPGTNEFVLVVRADIGNDTSGYSPPVKIRFPREGGERRDIEVEIKSGLYCKDV